ncbi:MAG: PASTA domain-containing protein, partial [Flavobacteriales bacterium]
MLFWLFFKFLDYYTNHGESLTVPDFEGLKIAELDEFCKAHQLNYVIIDSIYDLKRERGTVADQIPPPESQVKEGRKIYLTVVSELPEM